MGWWVKDHIAVNGDETKQLCSIEADTAADLPAADQSGTAGFIIVRGSDAKDVSTGDKYIMDSTGAWIQQPSGVQLDLTGYATTQELTDGLAAKVDTTTYTAGQAAQDEAIRAITGQGREIPSDSDLNNYDQIGLYQITTTAVAGSLINMPSECKVAGSIQMIRLNGAALAQVYRPNWASPGSRVGGYYIRQRTGASAWTGWYRFEGTAI